jgi:hypothetical protein
MEQARRQLTRARRPIVRLRWVAGAAAAAAVIVVATILFDPQSTIMSSRTPIRDRSPQSSRPGLAEGRADIDGSGRVDILDAFRLARHLESGGPAAAEWDLTGDGRVDREDVDAAAFAAVRLGPDFVARRLLQNGGFFGKGALPWVAVSRAKPLATAPSPANKTIAKPRLTMPPMRQVSVAGVLVRVPRTEAEEGRWCVIRTLPEGLPRTCRVAAEGAPLDKGV